MRSWREIRKLLRDRNGQGTEGLAAVELALVAPALLLLMVGTWDFGRAMQESARLTSAAHAGAQWGAYSMDNAADIAGIQTAAETDAGDLTNLTVTPTQYCECPSSPGTSVACGVLICGTPAEFPRMYVRVQVDLPFQTLFPYPFIAHPIALTRTTIMRAR